LNVEELCQSDGPWVIEANLPGEDAGLGDNLSGAGRLYGVAGQGKVGRIPAFDQGEGRFWLGRDHI
jgi:hypothetical protein